MLGYPGLDGVSRKQMGRQRSLVLTITRGKIKGIQLSDSRSMGRRCITGPHDETIADWSYSFVSYLVSWIVYGNMLPQMDAFNKGFFTVISPGHVCSLRPSTLRAILEGSATLDIKELRRVTHYDGYCDCDAYIQSFWTIVEGWPEAKQKQLIKFVTAVERFPAAGLEAGNFHFSINRVWISEPKVLPTSSTCFGVLYLPMYPDSETLERKLSIALEAGLGGFGAY